MKFEYSKIMKLVGFSDQQIRYFQKNTGYGQLYSNYKLTVNYNNSDLYKDVIIPINQCNDVLLDKQQQNCFVIFQSDYLPESFIKTIKSKFGYILINSQWMKKVVISQTNCDPNRIIILPYLENFQKLNKFKKVNVVKNQEVITFYTIADNKDVKNLLSLIYAFDIAFPNKKDVELIIKSSNAQFLQNKLNSRKTKFPKIILINKMLPEVQLYKLHMLGDIYVSTAYCVGWQIPPFQASYFKKPLICGNHSAFTEWVDFDKAITLSSYKKNILLKQYLGGRFKNIHNSGWLVNMIQIQEISSKLKYAYQNYDTIKNQYTDVLQYDIKNIDYFIQKNKV